MGAPAVEPPKNSTWRSSAPAGTTEHMMSAAVTRRGRAAGALCLWSRRAKAAMSGASSATCGRSSGSRSSSRRGESGASSITGGLGVQQQRSKRGKKLDSYFECQLSRRTVLGPLEKLAGGRARRVGAAPTGRAPRLGPSARGPRRRAAPGAHDAPPRGADAPPRSRWFGTKNTRRQGGGSSIVP